MNIRRPFQTNPFFSLQLKPVLYGLVYCWLLCASCHKEDTGAYIVTSEAFCEMAVPEQNFQLLLNEELSKVSADPRFPLLEKKG